LSAERKNRLPAGGGLMLLPAPRFVARLIFEPENEGGAVQ
jgi:hypothetical protein